MTSQQSQAAIKKMNTNNMRNATTPASVSCNKLNPISVLREELAAAVCHGVEWVEDLTEALVSRVVQRLSGVQVYVPSIGSLERERIAQEVRAKFTGRNHPRAGAGVRGATLNHCN